MEADGTLRKPFEASALIAAVKPLAEAARRRIVRCWSRASRVLRLVCRFVAAAPFVAVVDEEQVRAAVTVALDASMAVMVDEIARRVMAVLATRKPETAVAPPVNVVAPAPAKISPQPPQAAPPPTMSPRMEPRIEPVRRVSPLRPRTSSILGLDIDRDKSE